MADSSLSSYVRSISDGEAKPAAGAKIGPPAPQGALPGKTGQGFGAAATAKKGGGGGIDSPLTETAVTDRTYHPDKTIKSSDGLFSLVIKPLRVVKFKDAGNADVQIIFAEPKDETA